MAAGRDDDACGPDETEPAGRRLRVERRERAAAVAPQAEHGRAEGNLPARRDDLCRDAGDPGEIRLAGEAVPAAEPSAGGGLALRDEDAAARLGEGLGRGEPGRPCAHDQSVDPLLSDRAGGALRGEGGRIRQLAQAGEPPRDRDRGPVREQAPGHEVVVVEAVRVDEIDRAEQIVRRGGHDVLRLDREPVLAGRPAGALVREPAGADEARAARAGEAERAARPVVLRAARDQRAARGEERGRDRLAAPRRDGAAVEEDGAVGGEGR